MGIYQKGGNWYIDYYVKGHRKRKKIDPSKKDAELSLKNVQVKNAREEYLGIFEENKIPFDVQKAMMRLDSTWTLYGHQVKPDNTSNVLSACCN